LGAGGIPVLTLASTPIATVFLYPIQRKSMRPETRMSGASIGAVEGLKLVVVVDDPSEGLEATWGVSILAKTEGCAVLFDTGPSPRDH